MKSNAKTLLRPYETADHAATLWRGVHVANLNGPTQAKKQSESDEVRLFKAGWDLGLIRARWCVGSWLTNYGFPRNSKAAELSDYARNDIRFLLAEIDRLRALVAEKGGE